MLRTHAEIKEIASAVVSRVAADVMIEFPTVDKAILKLRPADWTDFLDEAIRDVE